MPRARKLSALILGIALFVVGCADLPSAPEPEAVEPEYGLLGDLVGVVTGTLDTVVDAVVGVLSPLLTREDPLEQDEVVSQWVGRYGGVIRLPRSGLTVVVPFGALDRYTRITVRAPAGDLFAYEFLPHGLEFERRVTVMQEVTDGEAAGGLEGIYFEGELQPEVTVLEVLPVVLVGDRAIFSIEHFSYYGYRRSGYVIATN